MITADFRIIGIDPGITGAVAVLTGDLVAVHQMPVADGEVDSDELARIVSQAKPNFAVVERVASRPGQGVASTFKFGASYGAARGVLAACQVPQHLITPSVWKRHFKLDADKEQARALAIKLWPGTGFFARKLDHGKAEAALIARYGAEIIYRGGRS